MLGFPYCNIGRKQSRVHILKKKESYAKTRESWSQEKHNQVRTKNSVSHKGQISWNKGNNWRDKYTPEEIRAIKTNRMRKYRMNNPKVRLNQRMSAMIYHSIKHLKNGYSWESFVGYTYNDLKKHIEIHFKPGMSWDNMGKWHIDHIIPKSYFNFSSPEHIDFKRCWALSNLQPLWKEENLKKGNKLQHSFQQSLAL